MSRTKIELPATFPFSTTIPVRITDLNYGNHVGNDTVLTYIHEARIRFLNSRGFSELNLAGAGLIMSDAIIEFKNELFYGDEIIASVAVGEFHWVNFDIYYKLEKKHDGILVLAAIAKTGMVCYDYQKKKVVSVPELARTKLIEG